MPISWFRDLAIIVFSSIATLVLIYMAILLYLAWKKLGPALDSLNAAGRIIERVSSEIIHPLVQLMAALDFISRGIETVSKFFKKEGGKNVE